MTSVSVTPGALPEGMALVETFDGRWFPAFAPDALAPQWAPLIEGALDIPPACDSLHAPGEGYQQREEAIEVCWAWHEAAMLPFEWERLAARIEVYPERTPWYLDEIARMKEHGRPVRTYGTSAFATVTTTPQEAHEVITARGATPDDAIETLYQRVYEWHCQQHACYQRASEHIPIRTGPSAQEQPCMYGPVSMDRSGRKS